MNIDEFKAFYLLLKRFVSENYNSSVSISACEIAESTNLFANEKEIIKKAVPKRVYEFSAGRMCARRCLSYYGLGDVELLKGKFGEPLWPEGYTGSITHHDNVAVAVAVQTNDFLSIGIDLVSQKDVIENRDLITCDRELKLLDNVGLDVDPGILIFSIKESAIKIFSPLLQEFIDFRDINLSWSGQGHVCASITRLNRLVRIKWVVASNSICCIATLDNLVERDNVLL